MAVNMSGKTHISAAGRARTEVTMVVIVPTIGTVVTIIIVVNNINLQMIFHGFLNFFKFKKISTKIHQIFNLKSSIFGMHP